jgi:SAM-dependent methyltransferase
MNPSHHARKLVDKLRGRHKSMRFRFWDIPRESLKRHICRWSGRTWIDYYAKFIDTKDTEALNPVPSYLDVGKEFLDYLCEHGLRPEHHLLDYGCGILRGGLQFVPYLQPHHYVGVEISASRLEQGRRLMDEAGIAGDSYSTLLVHDCSLRELQGRKFDYVWAHAVLMHMPESDIRSLLHSLKNHLNPNAVFLFTFFPSEKLNLDKVYIDQVRDFYYPTAYLQSIFESIGYDFVVMPRGYKENWGIRTRARLMSDGAQAARRQSSSSPAPAKAG